MILGEIPHKLSSSK